MPERLRLCTTTVAVAQLQEDKKKYVEKAMEGCVLFSDRQIDTYLTDQLRGSSTVISVDWSHATSTPLQDLQNIGCDVDTCIMDEGMSRILTATFEAKSTTPMCEMLAKELSIPLDSIFILAGSQGLFWVGQRCDLLLAEEDYKDPDVRNQGTLHTENEGNRIKFVYCRTVAIQVVKGVYLKQAPFRAVLGHTLVEVDSASYEDGTALGLFFSNGVGLHFYYGDWHGSAWLEDEGEIAAMVGQELVSAEVDWTGGNKGGTEETTHFTHTWYKLQFRKGDCTLTFRGESNGYYSEMVEIEVVKDIL